MKAITLTSALFLGLAATYSQTESINQLDSDGKRDGKWILYLDSKGEKLTDSVNAAYWRYTHYDHGQHIYPMGGFIGKKGKIESSQGSKLTGKIQMLDGVYKCFDSKGRLRFIHTFSKGEYISYKEFDKSARAVSFFDYKKHYEGQPHSWYIYTYDKSGNITYEGFVRKNDKGRWPAMRG